MIHKSELGEHAERFPADSAGHVPEQGDDWRGMSFEHGPHDPDEKGISDEERQRRIEHLDQEWWPNVIAQVNEEIRQLGLLPGGSPIKKWRDQVMREPPEPHGFEVE